MKRIIAIAAFILAATSSSFAFDGTVMSKANKVDYGVAWGYGHNSCLANFGSALIDFNANNSNFRVRTHIGSVERLTNPFASVNAQYLLPLAEKFYIYPTVGLTAESHKGWEELGQGTYGIGVQGGAGLEYQFSSHFGIFVEGLYQGMYNTDDRFVGQTGLIFHFGEGKRAAEREAAAAALAAEEAARAAAAKAAAEKAAAERAAAERAAAERAAAERAAAEKAAAERARIASRQSSENVLFLLDEYVIRDCEQYKIDNIVKLMKNYPEAVLTVSGYADKETGRPVHNMELSKNRAETVTAAIVAAGIDPSRITTEYYGDEVNPFPTPEQNRVAVCVTK